MIERNPEAPRKNQSAFSPFVVSLLAASLVCGCAAIRKSEDSPAPRESRFVRLEIPIPGTSRTYPVWRTRSPGRPILLFHAINGLSPDFLRFALDLEQWGYRVYLPSLYGDPISGEPAYGYDKEITSVRVIRRSGIWNPVSTESAGLIIEDAAAMARWVSKAEGGRHLAVIGNSLTGAFPLALLEEPCVRIAVLGQPAAPAKRLPLILLRIPQSPEKQRSLTLTEEKWNKIVGAMRRNPDKQILGFHYREDPMASIHRFDELHDRLSRAGLANRFTAYVMIPPGSPYASERRRWVVGAETREKQGMLTPHSTYLDSENEEDREWFRSHLRKALASAW